MHQLWPVVIASFVFSYRFSVFVFFWFSISIIILCELPSQIKQLFVLYSRTAMQTDYATTTANNDDDDWKEGCFWCVSNKLMSDSHEQKQSEIFSWMALSFLEVVGVCLLRFWHALWNTVCFPEFFLLEGIGVGFRLFCFEKL